MIQGFILHDKKDRRIVYGSDCSDRIVQTGLFRPDCERAGTMLFCFSHECAATSNHAGSDHGSIRSK